MKMIDRLKEIAKDPNHKILIGGAGPTRIVVRIKEFGEDYIDCMVGDANPGSPDSGHDRVIRLGAINDFRDVTSDEKNYPWRYTKV